MIRIHHNNQSAVGGEASPLAADWRLLLPGSDGPERDQAAEAAINHFPSGLNTTRTGPVTGNSVTRAPLRTLQIWAPVPL